MHATTILFIWFTLKYVVVTILYILCWRIYCGIIYTEGVLGEKVSFIGHGGLEISLNLDYH